MSTYENIKKLCKQHSIAVTALEKELGFGRGSIGKLRNGQTSAERLQKIADYFNVTTDFLLTGTDENGLTEKDNRDIAKDIEAIRSKLMNGSDGPLSYDGEPIPEEDAELDLRVKLCGYQTRQEYIIESVLHQKVTAVGNPLMLVQFRKQLKGIEEELKRLTTLEDADEELFTPIRTMLEILNAFAEERNYERRTKEKAQK